MPTIEQETRDMVRKGATIEVLFPDGVTVGPWPVVALTFSAGEMGFFWLGDDHDHVVVLTNIAHGDDGDILITDPESRVLKVWGIFEQQHLEQMAEYVLATSEGRQPKIGLDEGWTRYAQLE